MKNIEQLQEEARLHNLDLTRVQAVRTHVLVNGQRRPVVRVTHDQPACDMTGSLAERGLSLTRDCTSLTQAEAFMLRICIAVQPQERIVVRQALGVTGWDMQALRSTPLTSDELDRYREQIRYREQSIRLVQELAEAKRRKAERDEAKRIECEIRSRYHVIDEIETPSAQQLAENDAAQKRRTAKLKSPAAGAVLTGAAQEIPHHE